MLRSILAIFTTRRLFIEPVCSPLHSPPLLQYCSLFSLVNAGPFLLISRTTDAAEYDLFVVACVFAKKKGVMAGWSGKV